MGYVAFYLRRSSADDTNPGDVSREAQESACRGLAARDGWTGEVRTFVDWDRSADPAKEAKRTAFSELLSAINRGEVATVYAASLDRLYRSMGTFLKLTEAAEARPGDATRPPRPAVAIVTAREGRLGGDGSPMAQAFGQITATFAELELNTAKARARGAVIARAARGDAFGHAPYGYRHERRDGRIVLVLDGSHPLEPIIEAYRRAGSVLGAVKLLNAADVPSPNGKLWCATTVRRVLREEGVALPARGPSGRSIPAGASVLAQLVSCHCGHTLTPNAGRRQLYCSLGTRNPGSHGRYVVSEADILPFVRAEVARLRIPFDSVTEGEAQAGRLAGLAERKRRLALTFADGALDETEYRAELRKIAAETEAIEGAQRIIEIPPLNWEGPRRAVNEALRAILAHIELDEHMQAVRAEWRVPEWRSETA
jgi:DNA invertase Pin-like site-specific DNA recombinase